MDFSQIYEGWRNHLFPPEEIKKLITEVSVERLSVCKDCRFNSKNRKRNIRPDEHCVLCGCTLVAKTKCLSCSCPRNYWLAVLTLEEEEEINNEEE